MINFVINVFQYKPIRSTKSRRLIRDLMTVIDGAYVLSPISDSAKRTIECGGHHDAF